MAPPPPPPPDSLLNQLRARSQHLLACNADALKLLQEIIDGAGVFVPPNEQLRSGGEIPAGPGFQIIVGHLDVACAQAETLRELLSVMKERLVA